MQKMRGRGFRLLAIPAALAAVSLPVLANADEAAGALLAQANAGVAVAQPATTQVTGRIEEVVITARKDEESQQAVPVSVTALSDEALKQAAVTNVYDLAASVPGLFVATNAQGGAPTFAIRAAKADNGTSDTVTAYVDDVPMASTLSVSKMTYDMASISTLKGPQGTFFGTSTTGGAIIFRPNKPSDVFEGYVEVGVGNQGRKTLQGMVNIPINDVLQIRIAADMVKTDGWGKNKTPVNGNEVAVAEDHRSARLSVRLKPTTDLLNDLVVNYVHEDSRNDRESIVALRGRFNYPTFLGFSVPVDYALAGYTPSDDPYVASRAPFPTWNRAESIDVGNTTTYTINDNVSIKNVLGYQRIRTDTSQDGDAMTIVGITGRTAHNIEQWTEEFSVDTSFWEKRLRNKTGVFFSNRKIATGNAYRVLGLPWDTSGLSAGQITALNNFYPIGSNSFYWREFESKALYTQFSLDVTDTLTATLGARYTWDEGDYSASNKNAFPGAFGTGNYGDFFRGACNAQLASYKNFDLAKCRGYQDFKSSAPAYSFTLENKFSDRQMAYAAFRHGYLVGGFNNQVFTPDQAGQVFLPEEVTDAEFGLKSDWDLFDRPIRTNVALFFAHYKNQQRSQNGVTSLGTTYIAVQNAGATTAYGWDLDVIYDVTDWLRLSLGWNHVNAEYDNFKAPLNIPGVAGAFVDYQGKPIAQTPEDILSVSGTVTWPLSTDKGALSSTLSWYWRDSTDARDSPSIICSFAGTPPYTASNPAGECVAITEDYTEWDKLEDYAIVNFTTEWKNVMGSQFDVRFWVKNLFDKKYHVYGSNQMTGYGYANYFLSDPRQYGLNMRYNF